MVLLYIMQQRDILYYQLRVYNENTDNTIEVDAIKGSEECTVDDDELATFHKKKGELQCGK